MHSTNSECTGVCASRSTKTDICCIVLNSLPPPQKIYASTFMTFHQKTHSEKKGIQTQHFQLILYILTKASLH